RLSRQLSILEGALAWWVGVALRLAVDRVNHLLCTVSGVAADRFARVPGLANGDVGSMSGVLRRCLGSFGGLVRDHLGAVRGVVGGNACAVGRIVSDRLGTIRGFIGGYLGF